MMDAKGLKENLCRALVEQSGLEKRRPYLGMSGIGRCQRELYWQFVDGKADMGDQAHWNCWLGYLFERGMVGLFGAGMAPAFGEIVAGFDDRFRGHVDGETVYGDLVEIKSATWMGFRLIKKRGPKEWHRAQVQMYLRHGGYERGFLVYVARDIPAGAWGGIPIWVFEERPDGEWADALDGKARRVLAAVDEGRAPACECGRCKR